MAIAQGQAQQAGKAFVLDPEAAWKLMDYLMRPEVIAPITDTIHYANAITAADGLVDADIRNARESTHRLR